MAKLSTETIHNLQQQVEDACNDPKNDIPGLTVVVVGKNGQELFAHSAGKRGFESSEAMTLDNIFWIASCTKMITGIACMQLVEQKILALDDVAQVEKLCPELKEVKVLGEDGKLVEKERGITLRMLLTHTAGFGYAFFNEKLRDYNKPIGYDEFSGHMYDIKQPLVNQPGTRWEYGVSIDWAGILLERATSMSLNSYMQRFIFVPLGLENISMFPTQNMKDKLAHMHTRNPDGTISRFDHIQRRPLIVDTDEQVKECFNSGGAGCFAKPQEYCQILATLLNDGTSPKTGVQLLQKSTVDLMFTNQIPQFPQFGSRGIPDAKPWLTNPLPNLYPAPEEVVQGWGLTFMLSGGYTGRSKGTAFWAGLPNLWWWCDRERGVAGLVSSQILPFADAKVLGLWAKLEADIYQGLM
ncbi:probable beta-lactamase class C and other penicillin binding proteins [Phialocephala subalpina]|uniref:Probable beta-lactamase class C and other penicillin binding proteins n=1 Tax=Phialocephala subalpina TaxID=576137 RepID=A0A1L7WIX9_9HELO|nr:probable beta-lactamase class C and other penicillin binding proteins [Phialocephala subalpina]